MRTALTILALCALPAAGTWAEPIDGKYTAEVKMPAGKGKEAQQATITFELKASGGALTGTVTLSAGRRPRPSEIKDGKIEGNKLSFTTVQSGRKGELKFLWEGTLEGDELKLTRTREGGRRGMSFTAKRS